MSQFPLPQDSGSCVLQFYRDDDDCLIVCLSLLLSPKDWQFNSKSEQNEASNPTQKHVFFRTLIFFTPKLFSNFKKKHQSQRGRHLVCPIWRPPGPSPPPSTSRSPRPSRGPTAPRRPPRWSGGFARRGWASNRWRPPETAMDVLGKMHPKLCWVSHLVHNGVELLRKECLYIFIHFC